MGGRGSLRGRVGIRGGVHRQCFGRFKIRNGDENECLEVFWFHVQGFSIFPHGQNEEKEKNDEKGVSVKNWPLGGKVEMILCHLERFLPCHHLAHHSSKPPHHLHLSTYHSQCTKHYSTQGYKSVKTFSERGEMREKMRMMGSCRL